MAGLFFGLAVGLPNVGHCIAIVCETAAMELASDRGFYWVYYGLQSNILNNNNEYIVIKKTSCLLSDMPSTSY